MVSAVLNFRASVAKIAVRTQSYGKNVTQLFLRYFPKLSSSGLTQSFRMIKQLGWKDVKNQIVQTAKKVYHWVFGPSERLEKELKLLSEERIRRSADWQRLLRQPLEIFSVTLPNPMLDFKCAKVIEYVMKSRQGVKLDEQVMVDLRWQVETEELGLVHHQFQVVEPLVDVNLRSIHFLRSIGAKVKMIPLIGVKCDKEGGSIVQPCYHPIPFNGWAEAQERRFNLQEGGSAAYRIFFASHQERLHLMRAELSPKLSRQFKEYTTNPRSVQEIIYRLAELLKISPNVWFNDFQWKE